MVSMTTSWEVSGRARQLRLIAENKRCSILFHLLVPGGRWHTVIVSPISVASAASSVVHNRSRKPLDPPESAVINNLVAVGYASTPMVFHHRRIDSTANCPVSASVPTFTQPAFAAMSYTPYGATFACRLYPLAFNNFPPADGDTR